MAETAPPITRPPAGPASILGPGCRFDGLVQLREAARIDGTIEGEIVATDLLMLGETARVRARIEAAEVVIAGAVEGDIVASQRIELAATARVVGTLRSPRITLAEGCLLEGRCETGEGIPRGATSRSMG